NIVSNLYKPVTSTKGKGHSGVGLSIVKNLIDNMNGKIICKTGESGTSFSIQLPLLTKE
ncbi:MAG: ATP-binding protein, partial [Gammaproteobacteria bacterium]|nr:ATP-binding protein [Gammaproteobacteria bacterium]